MSGKAVWKMHWPKLDTLLWLSINFTSKFPIILSLSCATYPRAIEYGSVHDAEDVNVKLSSRCGWLVDWW